MSSMLKLLIIAILASSAFASSLKEKIIEFEKQSIDPRIEVEKLEVTHEIDVVKGWKGYILDLTITMQGQTRDVKDILFSDGNVVTRELLNLSSGDSYNAMMEEYTYPTLDSRYHKKEYLIAGKHGAKNKLVVFSNPGCPHCVNLMPGLIEQVQSKDDVALYYIKSGSAISLAMLKAKQDGVKDVAKKLYSALAKDKQAIAQMRDPEKSLEFFNKVFDTQITQEQITENALQQKLQTQMHLAQEAGIKATPTIFVNGKIDRSRTKMQEVLR